MVSIREVAQLAGVSIATVSRTINNKGRVAEEMRERVRRAIASTGFSPNTLAQNFRRGRTRSILVVLPSLGDTFVERLVKGIRARAHETGYDIFFSESDSTRSISALLSRQVDGLILLAGVTSEGADILAQQKDQSLPIVVANDAIQTETLHLPSVRIDDMAAAQEATRFLIGRGHERIAFIGSADSSLPAVDREAGYRSAMKSAKLPVRGDWVLAAPRTIDGVAKATRSLLRQFLIPTAIVCGNDEIAIAAMHELRAADLRVPEDISVIGFDDILYCQLTTPPLTTISQPAEDIGKRAMSRIVDAIERKTGHAPAAEVLQHKLVARGSVSPYKSAVVDSTRTREIKGSEELNAVDCGATTLCTVSQHARPVPA